MDVNTAAIIISFVVIVFLLLRKTKTSDDKVLLEWLRSTGTRLDEQSRVVAQAARSIGEMSEIGRSMKDLQQFLASPKMRGGLGEQVLRQLLEESLPRTSFNLQYTFRSGVKVDAVIKTASGIIPIDSKFSMENFKKMVEDKSFEKDFQRDVKARIDEVANKYILADEGTVDFALMYVPAESVYYEIVNSGLMDYAYKQRVMPVSPSTFYAFLRSILLSFEGQKITAEIKTIQQALRAIHTETNKFAELLATLQSHINNSYAMMNKVATQFVGLSSKVDNVQSLGSREKETEKLED